MRFLGREKELNRILALIRAPKDAALVVLGKHGSGKSALLAEIPTLHNYRTVFLRAHPSEAEWSYSGLISLINGIDEPPLTALSKTLGEDIIGNNDLSAISAMVLEGLRRRSSARTVIVIDDADELDAASQSVVGYLARRLAGTGIVLIASMGREAPDSPFSGLPSLWLQNLSQVNTVRMLESLPLRPTTPAILHAVAAASQGNPLAARECYSALLERNLQGEYALPVPLRWDGSFDADLAASLSGLSPRAKRALELLCLSYRTSISALLTMPDDLWPGIDEALNAGVAVRSGNYVRIHDQLLRAFLFSTMSPGARAASHQALADAADAVDPVARSWHRSYAAPRREVSFELFLNAAEMARAGETQFAVEYIERALTINPWEAEVAARLAVIADVLFNRGEFVFAKRYLDWAQKITKSRALTLRLTGLDFQISLMQGHAVRPSMVLRLIKEFGYHDRAYSACLLSTTALYFAERWEIQDARNLLAYAEEFISHASGDALDANRRARLLIKAVQGEADLQPRTAAGDGNNSTASLLLKGRVLTYAENYEGARDAFAVVQNVSEASSANWRETALFFAADNEIRAGNFRAAIEMIEALDRAEESPKYHRGMRNMLLLWRAHMIGDEVEAKLLLADAQHFASTMAQPSGAGQIAACQGHFALMRGDLAEAFAQLGRAAEIGLDYANPGLLRCESDLVEVLVRLGHHREAVRALTRLEYRASGMKSRWLGMVISRCRALVADGEQSLELFVHALESWQKNDSVFERARTSLCYAERLKTFGRLKESKTALLRAKALFEEAGAAAWIRHVDALLLDEPPMAAPEILNPALLMLTDQERELAQMVARGRRNKEIAALLYVSVRTVEVRLTGIYRKLGVQSRSQLTSLVAERESVSSPAREAVGTL